MNRCRTSERPGTNPPRAHASLDDLDAALRSQVREGMARNYDATERADAGAVKPQTVRP